MSASLDRAREKCADALVRLEQIFTSDCRLTLVMRSTTNKDAFFVLSGDDLSAIEELLARARGVVARGPGQWRNRELARAVRDASDGVPEGWLPVEAYRKGDELVMLGIPAPDHNCDVMACGSMTHVVARASIRARGDS